MARPLLRARFLAAVIGLGCAVGAAAGCSRELSVPAQPRPPAITAVTPSRGFTGDTVTLTGTNLGGGLAQVFFGLRLATVVSAAADGTQLVVSVPAQITGPTIAVVTPDGRGVAGTPFHYLGLGHPASAQVRSNISLLPSVVTAAPLAQGTVFAMADQRYGAVLAVDSSGALLPPVPLGGLPQLVFGDDARPWVWDGRGNKLRHLDLGAGAELAAEALQLQVDPSAFLSPGRAATSPSGKRFVLLIGGNSLLTVDLSTRTQKVLAIGAADESLLLARFTSEDALILATSVAPYRIDLAASPAAVVAGAPFAEEEVPGGRDSAAVWTSPGKTGRFAYHQGFGKIGFIDFTDDPTQAPVMEAGAGGPVAFDPQLKADALAFSPDGTRLLVMSTTEGGVLSFDCHQPGVQPTPATARPLDAPVSLSPVLTGPLAGYLLAGLQRGRVAVLLPSGDLVKTLSYPVFPTQAVSTASGDALVGSSLGLLLLDRSVLSVRAVALGLRLDGLTAGQPLWNDGASAAAEPVAWKDASIYRYVAGSADGLRAPALEKVATSPGRVDSAALSPDGQWVAAIGHDGGYTLSLLPRAGNTRPAVTAQFGDKGGGGNLLYLGDTLVVMHPDAAGKVWVLTAYAPGTLTVQSEQALVGDSYGLQLLYSAAYDAVFISMPVVDKVTSEVVQSALTLWRPTGAVKAWGGAVDISAGLLGSISADGRVLFSAPLDNFEQSPGLQLGEMGLVQGAVDVFSAARVPLASPFSMLASTPDGGRVYAALPDTDAIAVIE